jgi:uncharacterized membrane protein YphA (DoxX/SURF4 family)
MRVVAAIALANQVIARPPGVTASTALALSVMVVTVAILLVVGLWTPVAGALVALIEFWNAFSNPGDPWFYILLGTLGVALALLGPGAWSADARLFGWKRIDIRDRKS